MRVDLGPRSYDIVIGDGVLAEIGARMAAVLSSRRAHVITDENVAPHYLDRVMASLGAAGFSAGSTVLPAGEATKSFAQLEALIDRLLVAGVERNTCLVALGGGVIGDLVGFTASILLRGTPFVQVPTTLLSQVDSSVGGKTGINTPRGKNLVGSFYQPKLVLADMETLNTLPRRELLAGYAEVVKYGLIDRSDFFDWLVVNGAALVGGDLAARRYAVHQSCTAKADLVAQDELEKGRRALLNLGHTFGHALEAETGYDGALLHGEAVAIGIVMAFDLSARLGLCPQTDADRARAHLAAVGLPVDVSDLETEGWTADRLLDHMGKDKKVSEGVLTFILVRRIGEAFITQDVPRDAVHDLLGAALAA
ncbi:MAG: 3-dehydroquinate synthase [Magnetospiraceae bacterium]